MSNLYNKIIPESPKKPLRIWMGVGDRDLLNPNVMRDNMHDWVKANNEMANNVGIKMSILFAMYFNIFLNF